MGWFGGTIIFGNIHTDIDISWPWVYIPYLSIRPPSKPFREWKKSRKIIKYPLHLPPHPGFFIVTTRMNCTFLGSEIPKLNILNIYKPWFATLVSMDWEGVDPTLSPDFFLRPQTLEDVQQPCKLLPSALTATRHDLCLFFCGGVKSFNLKSNPWQHEPSTTFFVALIFCWRWRV